MEVWVLNFMIEISVDTLNSFSDQNECCFFFQTWFNNDRSNSSSLQENIHGRNQFQ